MKKAGRPPQGKTRKVRTTLTMDPGLLKAIKELFGVRANISAFFEQAGWRYLKTLSKGHSSRVGPKRGPE